MLKGEVVTLRPVREADIDTLRELDLDLDSRGDYWPLGIMSEVEYRRGFEQQRTGMFASNRLGRGVHGRHYHRSKTMVS